MSRLSGIRSKSISSPIYESSGGSVSGLLSACEAGVGEATGCLSRLLGFSPWAQVLSLSGLCENQDAAAREGHPASSSRHRQLLHEVRGVGRGGASVEGSSV